MATETEAAVERVLAEARAAGGDRAAIEGAITKEIGRARFKASARRLLGPDASDAAVIAFVGPQVPLTMKESARRLLGKDASDEQVATFLAGR